MSQNGNAFGIRLEKIEGPDGTPAGLRSAAMEFHVHRGIRAELKLETALFSLSGNCVLANFSASRSFALKYNELVQAAVSPERSVKAGQVNAMGLIDEILHYVCSLYRDKGGKDVFSRALASVERSLGKAKTDGLLREFTRQFPPTEVFKGKADEETYLAGSTAGVSNRELALEELLMLWLANDNPAFVPFRRIFDDTALRAGQPYLEAVSALTAFFRTQPAFGPDDQSLVEMLKAPAIAVPNSLPGQLEYMRSHWGLMLGKYLLRLLTSLDLIKEEEKPFFPGPGPTRVLVYDGLEQEYERFSPDKDWMPRTVMIAKSTLVWLHQLSEKYGRSIARLDQIPDDELDILASRGFTALWLIGIWERSPASRRIKQVCGNPEAAASAYSLFDYDIAENLGGWGALANLRERAWYRGLRLASDMVPNHTGMDSRWVNERPDLFLQRRDCPFPGYSFNGENLSGHPGVGVYLEDRYYSKTDAAVVFKRVDFGSGETRYIYHGNDGTSMPWNDTAQIDFLNPEARAAVMEKILNVAKNFPIIRFDAAMVLAKKHIRRLWYPEPGSGGDIPSRAENALSREDFDRAIPNEFWREVVDLCAKEAPDTLLLAEAFWMLEGYFVRTLGMHRVYNSAFMNMLKREENAKYRSTIKNTQEFDPEILRRFVNFLNNPDEETAVAQFGRGDKYFGVCTMMVTMPGLPMFGHGQVEGFEEKYGMEYHRSYWKESPDQALVERHEREIFPVMKKRYLFAGAESFLLYDLFGDSGAVNENVFAYSNRCGREAALVLYNNAFAQARGWLMLSAARAEKAAGNDRKLVQRSLGDGLGLSPEGGWFALMREQRSNLWFIRESKELWEKGMYVMLDGYQCQVFLDVRGVLDNELGQYRKLCVHLAGAGVRDIQAAIQDIFLDDLYQAFYRFFSAERLSAFRDLSLALLGKAPAVAAIPDGSAKKPQAKQPAVKESVAKKSPESSIKAFISEAKAPASEFFRTACKFLGGTAEYGAFEGRTAAGKKHETDSVSIFVSGLKSWFELLARIKSVKADSGLLGALASDLENGPFRIECAISMAVLAAMRGIIGTDAKGEALRRLIDHWCVDRKIVERLEAIGFGVDLAWESLGFIKAALCRDDESLAPAKQPKAKASKAAAAAILPPAIRLFLALSSDDESRRLLGVNAYDGKLWYRKEGLDQYLAFECLAGILFDRAGTMRDIDERLAEQVSLFDLFIAAGQASEYQLDALGEAIAAATSPAAARITGAKKAPTQAVKAKKATNKKDSTAKPSGAKVAIKKESAPKKESPSKKPLDSKKSEKPAAKKTTAKPAARKTKAPTIKRSAINEKKPLAKKKKKAQAK
jgi:glycosidase